MEGTYRLARQFGGVYHYAQVSLELDLQAEDDVSLSSGAFDWLYGVYGPNAWLSGYQAEFGPDAVAGVLFGLRQVDAHARVIVTKVDVMPADTTPLDVRFAAAQAVWQLLGQRPAVEPQLGDPLP